MSPRCDEEYKSLLKAQKRDSKINEVLDEESSSDYFPSGSFDTGNIPSIQFEFTVTNALAKSWTSLFDIYYDVITNIENKFTNKIGCDTLKLTNNYIIDSKNLIRKIHTIVLNNVTARLSNNKISIIVGRDILPILPALDTDDNDAVTYLGKLNMFNFVFSNYIQPNKVIITRVSNNVLSTGIIVRNFVERKRYYHISDKCEDIINYFEIR